MGQKKVNIEALKARIEEMRKNKDVLLKKLAEKKKEYNTKKEAE